MSNFMIGAVILLGIAALATVGFYLDKKRLGILLAVDIVCLVCAMTFLLLEMDQNQQDYHDHAVAALLRLKPNAVLGEEVHKYTGIFWISQGEEKELLACIPDFDHCVVFTPEGKGM